MNTQPNILNEALAYLRKGFSIIPVSKDKKPFISWQKYTTERATEQEVKEWFMKYQDCQIAIVTGKISNCIVVDIEKGGDLFRFLPTLMSSTGGGGFHLYYKYTPGIKNAVRVFELTDIRSDGGYVIAPPSESSKGKYKWEHPCAMKEFPREMFKTVEKVEKPTSLPLYRGISEGGRNDAMARYSGLIIRYLHHSEWETKGWTIVKNANKQNTPPLPEDELKNTYDSICKREKANPSPGAVGVSTPIIEEETNVDDDEILPMSEVAARQSIKDVQTFSTGFTLFDEVMGGGFKEGDLVVITAPTGMGKTTFAQTLTRNAVVSQVPVLFFSFEVLVRNLWEKFAEMGLTDTARVYSPSRITCGTIDWIEKRVLDGIDNYGTKIIVLDHLGFLTPKKQAYDVAMSSNYSAFLGSVCRDLKTLAIKNDIVILLLVHLKKTDKPTINDIRDSSGIAQESDYVFMLERLKAGKDEALEYTNDTTISIVKNRLTGLTPRVICKLENFKFTEKFDVKLDLE